MATTPPQHDEDPAHRDPISGEPGAHPVGVGVGAAGGGAIGAGIGAVGGPVGAVIGAGVGGVVGGWLGREIAEAIDPTAEEAHWRENFASRPYATGAEYNDYAAAYRYGWESAVRRRGSSFDDSTHELEAGWMAWRSRGDSPLSWEKAKYAVRDAWDRIAAQL